MPEIPAPVLHHHVTHPTRHLPRRPRRSARNAHHSLRTPDHSHNTHTFATLYNN